MHKLITIASMGLMISANSCSTGSDVRRLADEAAATLSYPAAPADSSISDEYFGINVTDLYRPLENDTSAETGAWVEAEREVTENYLGKIPFRGQIRERLAELNNYRKTGTPWKGRDKRYYYYENDGLQNQSVLYRKDSLNGKPEVFLDPNKLSDDGTVALNGIYPDHKNRYMAYSISRNGSDWNEIFVMDLNSGALLPDHIEWAKFSGATWHGDGFYYSAYERPEAGKEFSNSNENQRIYYHKMGTPQSDDILIYEDTEHPLYFHSVAIDEDEKALFLYISGNGKGNALKIKDLRKPDAPWVTMEPTQDEGVSVFEVIGDTLYIETSHGAPRSRIMTATIDRPARSDWKELVPEQDGVLIGAQMAGGKMILTYDKDAINRAYLYDLDGNRLNEIELPAPGTVYFSTDKDDNEVFYSFTSFLYPSSTFTYDIESGKSVLYHSPEVAGFNPDDYTTEQIFYTSADGTRIPMFLTYKKGLKRDGKNPTLLYGYGGFNITLNPGFSPSRLLWLENGGVYAMANLRGGGEYGEEWHEAGTKLNKLNVFNDFIAAAEWLIEEQFTTPGLLTIQGGSNGGLLVGATVNMRPDLFAVAIPEVGVMDMMRYHKFTIGWNWAPDYGTSADSPEMAEYLLGYSPVHNIKNDGTPYPAIMVTTGDHDDRVVPAHSFKYAATLQASDTGDKPKIIRIDSKAGHGGGKPIAKRLDEAADIYAFIFFNLGIAPGDGK